MTTPPPDSTSLVFLAPPSTDSTTEDAPYDDEPSEAPRPARGGRAGGAPSVADGGGASLRMLKGAREAAAGMKVSDEQIRRVLDDPQDVRPDPNQPHRTRLQRDGVVLTTGQDGMILRVARKR